MNTVRSAPTCGEPLAESNELVDYGAIESRSTELGFPVSIRTLRFYVGEGLLPPPTRSGRSAVFPQRQTLDRLLIIHLMQTRFGLPLSTIKRILDHLRTDPAELAEKCRRLYGEIARPDRFQQVERQWLIDAFTRTLIGDLELYPRSKRFQTGPRQPREILISELIEDLELHADWIRDASGRMGWTSPETAIGSHSQPEGIKMPPSRGQSSLSITPVNPPEGAVTPATARSREEQFLHRFERNLHRVKRVFSPLENRYHTVKSNQLDPEIEDPYQKVVDLLKELGLYDRALLDALPHDRSTRYTFPARGVFGKRKPRLVISALVRSPLADLARLGGALDFLGRDDALASIREQLRDPGAYHVIGILSTVGWDRDVFDRVPRGEDFSVVLVEPLGCGGWRIADSLPRKLTDLRTVFDPEETSEKVGRTFYRIMEDPELSIPGGHIELERLLEEMAVDRDVLNRALVQVEQEDSRIRLTRVAGREILKRDRY